MKITFLVTYAGVAYFQVAREDDDLSEFDEEVSVTILGRRSLQKIQVNDGIFARLPRLNLLDKSPDLIKQDQDTLVKEGWQVDPLRPAGP